MMSAAVPEAFARRMRQQLGPELPAFLCALEAPPLRGIRINPLKRTEAADVYRVNEPVPWTKNAYLLPADSTAGSSVFHEAGAFYIQEPGAMIPAAVLDAKPGERILDLCAAPGGKSTQIGCAMKGEGLLVCNEPVPKRAQILSRNIERMGLPNTIVTCAWPEQLAEKWPEGFDAVLVDAPCSGEGMFRRDPETRKEWTEQRAAGCAERQKEILAEAAGLVRPGGRLVYSTCTYNPAENEENVQWFTGKYPEYKLQSFSLQGIEAPEGMYTCYPHRVKGEGQFAALFIKEGNKRKDLPEDRSLPHPSGADIETMGKAFPWFPASTHLFGRTMICLPEIPDLKGIRIIRAGLHLGEVNGKVAVPDHAAALCFRIPDGIAYTDILPEQASRYMAGETIQAGTVGWTVLRCRGLALGWGKGSGGIVKNHYPKGLRGLNFHP